MSTVLDGLNGLAPLPGSFGLSKIGGTLGSAIHIGQMVLRDTSIFTHAFMVLDHGEVLEARPGGAWVIPIDVYLQRPIGEVTFCDYPVIHEAERRGFGSALAAPYESTLRAAVVREARALEGVGYNFLDYLALGLLCFGVKRDWVVRRMQRSDKILCSQAVDIAYRHAGIQLFDDGRYPWEVTPGDLDRFHRTHPAPVR